jgi:hypothetical protein
MTVSCISLLKFTFNSLLVSSGYPINVTEGNENLEQDLSPKKKTRMLTGILKTASHWSLS